MVLQSLLKKIKERNFRGIAKQTEQLDSQTRQHLQEYLQVVPGEKQELEDLEEELYDATVRLHDLQEKEEFIATRLKAYQTKLKQIANGSEDAYPPLGTTEQGQISDDDDDDENSSSNEQPASPSEGIINDNEEDHTANTNLNTNNANAPPTPTTTTPPTRMSSAKQDEHKQALDKVQQVHKTMRDNIKELEKKIANMEKRKLELHWHLEECQVVLDTTKEIERIETELAAEQAVQRFDEDSKDVTIPVDIKNNNSNSDVAAALATNEKQEEDEEFGQIEIVDLQAAKNKDKEEDNNDDDTSAGGQERIQAEDPLASRIAITDEELGESSDAK
ncbi:unnamed protein product [Cylindrotheca closterium]|uniref:Uncharacterized protein n=1 Tax=Cylindrotheca closterium TaxID=2856 RepID=A0AAD2G4D5_9STRA|nr:unnamed protein product [Cylindrotheca closterium]